MKTIYNDDETLINTLALLEATYSFENGSLIKNANIAEFAIDELKSFGSHLVTEVTERINKEGVYSVLTFFAPGMLGAIWAPLGLGAWFITIVGIAFDVSLGSILATAARSTKEKLDSGEPFTDADAERIANEAIQTAGGIPVTSEYFLPLRTMIKEGKLLSTAREGFKTDIFKSAGPKTGILKAIFSKLISTGAKAQGRLTILGLLKLTIKKILKAVVIVSAAGWVMGKEPGGAPTPESEESSGITPGVPSIVSPGTQPIARSVSVPMPQKMANNLTPTGLGLTYRINSQNRIWIVPLQSGGSGVDSIRNTMFFWATKVYQEVGMEHHQLVMTSPAFIQMLRVLSTNYTPSAPRGLQMPQNEILSSPIHSVKDVVDYFIWQTAPKIKLTKESE